MDKTLVLKSADFKKALRSLEMALVEKKTELVRDAVVKRFEYTYEVAWKTVKVYLDRDLGVPVFSPKTCWREMLKNQLLSDKETQLLLEMTDDRNEIIHTYDENFSNVLYAKIKHDYCHILKKVYTTVSASRVINSGNKKVTTQ